MVTWHYATDELPTMNKNVLIDTYGPVRIGALVWAVRDGVDEPYKLWIDAHHPECDCGGYGVYRWAYYD